MIPTLQYHTAGVVINIRNTTSTSTLYNSVPHPQLTLPLSTLKKKVIAPPSSGPPLLNPGTFLNKRAYFVQLSQNSQQSKCFKIYEKKKCWESFEEEEKKCSIHFMCIAISIVQWGSLYKKLHAASCKKKKNP